MAKVRDQNQVGLVIYQWSDHAEAIRPGGTVYTARDGFAGYSRAHRSVALVCFGTRCLRQRSPG